MVPSRHGPSCQCSHMGSFREFRHPTAAGFRCAGQSLSARTTASETSCLSSEVLVPCNSRDIFQQLEGRAGRRTLPPAFLRFTILQLRLPLSILSARTARTLLLLSARQHVLQVLPYTQDTESPQPDAVVPVEAAAKPKADDTCSKGVTSGKPLLEKPFSE